jgi:2OG-Fe(II) oxygenase superfamily
MVQIGPDYISEHSDKTLDITRDTAILSFSLGATRTLTLRSKAPAATGEESDGHDEEPFSQSARKIEKIRLPHNSLFVLGWETNRHYYHSIKADKRRDAEKSPDELACGGQRISLTFRSISTFYHRELQCIFGQGAPIKSLQSLIENTKDGCTDGQRASESNENDAATDREDEYHRMINAFSAENKDAEFDWEKHYDAGFSWYYPSYNPDCTNAKPT